MTICVSRPLSVGIVFAWLSACSVSDQLINPQFSASRVVASPATALADGVSVVNVAVTVLLPGTVPLSGVNVRVVGTNCTVTQAQAVTDANGQVTATARSTAVGQASLSAIVSTPEYQINLPQTAAVTFEAAPIITAPTPALVTHFGVVPAVAQVDANQVIALVISALDANNQLVSSYTGEVHTTSTDLQAILPLFIDFLPDDMGTKSIATGFALRTAGTQSITVTDEVTLTAGTAAGLRVQPAAATVLQASISPNVIAGAAAQVQVAVFDAFGNATPDYTGSLSFRSTDTHATLPAAYLLMGDSAAIDAFFFETAGLQMLTVYDTANTGISDVVSVPVAAGPVHALNVTAPASATAGVAFVLGVTAVDSYGNTILEFADTVGFTSSDSNAVFATPSYHFVALDAGTKQLSGVMLTTARNQNITVTDASMSSLTTQVPISISPAGAQSLLVTIATSLTAGSATDLQVTALDPFANVATQYAGTVAFRSTDSNAVLPPRYTFSVNAAGIGQFSQGVTFETAGMQTLSVADIAVTSIEGSSATLQVSAAPATQLVVTQVPHDISTCTDPNGAIAVTVQDAHGNTANASPNIVLSLQANPQGAQLTGTLNVQATAGTAVFNDFQLNIPVSNYRFVVTDVAGVLTAGITPALSVTDAPPQIVNIGNPNATASCIGLPYSVQQACGAEVSVLVEYAVSGGAYQHATQSARGSLGVVNLPSSPAAGGRAASFTWDSTRDLPHSNTTASLRLTPRSNATMGAPQVISNVAVNNGLAFAARQDTAVTGASGCIVTADFNQDAHSDVAVCLPGANQMVVGTGTGSGTFIFGTPFAAGAAPTVGVVVDSNRDGLPDLIVAGPTNGNVSIIFDTRSATFSTSVLAVVGGSPSALAMADVDRNGRLDVVAVDAVASTLSWALQSNSNTFAAAHSLGIGATATGVVVADMTRDGYLDAAITLTNNQWVLAVGGASGFTLGGTWTTGTSPSFPIISDVNHDGAMDVTLINATDSTLQVFLGDGTGNFLALAAVAVLGGPVDFKLGDMDGDGNRDAVVLSAGSVGIYTGDGQGRFSTALQLATAGNAVGLQLSDVGGDSKLDIVTANNGSVSTFINQPAPRCSWGLQLGYITVLTQAPTSGALADFDRDGKPDVVTCGNGNSVVLTSGDGAGGVGTPSVIATGIGPLLAPVAVDFNRDGFADVAAAVTGNASLLLALNQNTAGFATSSVAPLPAAASSLAAADMTSDAVPDLIALYPSLKQVAVLVNDGNAHFTAAATVATAVGPTSLTTGDINGDGTQDVVVVNSASASLTVLLGDGMGGLRAVTSLSTLPQPRAAVIADFNGDGIADIAAGCYSGFVITFLGSANGTFGTGVKTTTLAVTGLSVVDFNNDGVADLYMGTDASDQPSVAQGLGNGQFAPSIVYADQGPTHLLPADMNGDGLIDFVSINKVGSIDAVLNTAQGFLAGINSSGVGLTGTNALLDFNQDGQIDIALPDGNNGQLSLHIGDGTGAFYLDQNLAGSGPLSVSVGDLNRDSWTDVVWENRTSNGGANISLYQPANLQFAPPTSSSSFSLMEGSTIAEFTGDGILDLAIADCGGYYNVLAGDGAGNFTNIFHNASGNCPDWVGAYDVDNNGTLDLVGYDAYDNYVFVFTNNGTGSFTRKVTLTMSVQVNMFIAADVNHDGKNDLVIGTTAGVYYAYGQGNAAFASPQMVLAQNVFFAGDFNEDGNMDFAYNLAGDSVAVVLGDATAHFAAPRVFATSGPAGYQMLLYDVNHDGLQDALFAHPSTGLNGLTVGFGW